MRSESGARERLKGKEKRDSFLFIVQLERLSQIQVINSTSSKVVQPASESYLVEFIRNLNHTNFWMNFFFAGGNSWSNSSPFERRFSWMSSNLVRHFQVGVRRRKKNILNGYRSRWYLYQAPERRARARGALASLVSGMEKQNPAQRKISGIA